MKEIHVMDEEPSGPGNNLTDEECEANERLIWGPPEIPTKASAFMKRKDWDRLLAQKGHKIMAKELLEELYSRQCAGVVDDAEINMNLSRINLLMQGMDMEY